MYCSGYSRVASTMVHPKLCHQRRRGQRSNLAGGDRWHRRYLFCGGCEEEVFGGVQKPPQGLTKAVPGRMLDLPWGHWEGVDTRGSRFQMGPLIDRFYI
jgi:hypothetical protein